MSSTPIAEDYDDIARRLKELEREKAPPQPEYTPAELLVRENYGHHVPVPGWEYLRLQLLKGLSSSG